LQLAAEDDKEGENAINTANTNTPRSEKGMWVEEGKWEKGERVVDKVSQQRVMSKQPSGFFSKKSSVTKLSAGDATSVNSGVKKSMSSSLFHSNR